MAVDRPAPEPGWAVTALGLTVVWLLAAGLLAGQCASLLARHGTARLLGGVGLASFAVYTRGLSQAFAPAPPAWLFWPLLVLFWSGPLAGVLWLWVRFGYGAAPTSAQWGGRRTERQLLAPEDPLERVDRMAVGRGKASRKILAGKSCISAVVFGNPGSSKTTGLGLPVAAEWQGPLVATTVKASDFDAIYARRAELGPVWVLAPAGLPDRETACWSPVDYCVDAKAADRMAGWLADAAATAGDPKAAPWVEQAKYVIKGVLLAANLADGGITAFRRWLTLAEAAVDDVRSILADAGYKDVADDYAAPFQLHDDGVGSVKFTMATIARVYADEEVRATAARSDFTAEEFLDQCGTICLIASETDAVRFAPLLTAVTASVIHAAQSRYKETSRPLSPALGLVIDEAGNMFRYPALPRLLTSGRGMGIAALTIWHDLSQLISVLGREAAHTVVSASGMRVLLPGNGDLETLQLFSRLFGRAEVTKQSTTYSSGSVSRSEQTVETDLAPIHYLQQLPDFTAVVQYANLPPLRVKLRRTYVDRDLVALLNRKQNPNPMVPAPADPVKTGTADLIKPTR
ncbi:type IV secretory system conjugative DNA transfer family protein [Kitasatospora sp. CB02891]|uniref:type IV secretory system conjugative DNA transfer family protein n=1 Tax=Kitasatospora sp. CB02891 TaxID=2020329 RepID=UPI0018E250CD|nr:type IV secretory system conjugative DNA transfer family protein [Kitasatospora sp. CB02891]